MIGIVIYNMLGFSLPGNMAGSLQNPKRNFPTAMFISIILIIANYFLPVLLVAAARLPSIERSPRWSEWQLGYFSLAAQEVSTLLHCRISTSLTHPSAAVEQVAGSWLASWISASSVLASFCSVEANIAATAHSLHAMSELGFFPAIFTRLSKKCALCYRISQQFNTHFLFTFSLFQHVQDALGCKPARQHSLCYSVSARFF
jgi:amino acid transporter